MRKWLITITAVIALISGIFMNAGSAQAADPNYQHDSSVSAAQAAACAPNACFALYCDWPAGNARPRLDLTNVFITQLGAKVDATDAWYRSTRSSTGQPVTGWGVDIALIQLYDGAGDGWVNWTSRQSNPITNSNFHWDPPAKYNITENFTAIRAYFRSAGGQTCYSNARST